MAHCSLSVLKVPLNPQQTTWSISA